MRCIHAQKNDNQKGESMLLVDGGDRISDSEVCLDQTESPTGKKNRGFQGTAVSVRNPATQAPTRDQKKQMEEF